MNNPTDTNQAITIRGYEIGNMMKIEEMTDEHLVNRIAWVKRNMPDHWKIHGDELPSASLTRALIDEDIEKVEAHIKDMETELDKRKKGSSSYE